MKNKIKMIEKPDQWQLNKHEIKICSRSKCLHQLLKKVFWDHGKVRGKGVE